MLDDNANHAPPDAGDPAWTPLPPKDFLPVRPLIERPRLLDVLAGRFERRVTVLVAGAGFGKTSLLHQAWLTNVDRPRGTDVWLRCRSVHDSASVLAPDFATLVGAPDVLGMDPERAARALADAIWQRVPRHVALLLDDVHLVPAGSSGAQLLTTLLDMLPANGHLVLASRVRPPLPLARLTALGQVTWMEESDLRFSPEEMAAFSALRSVPIQIVQQTGGWPALAELAAERPGGTHLSTVHDFLSEEVLSKLSAQRRRFLVALVHVGDVDAELAAAAVGEEIDLGDVLADLPLVIRAGGQYHIHALWQQALAKEIGPEEGAGVRTRAAEVLARRGNLVEAMRLASQETHWPAMRVVIRAACSKGRVPVAPDVLRSWLNSIPQRYRTEPEALMLSAIVNMDRPASGAVEQFREAAERFRASGDLEGELATLTHWAILAVRTGDQVAIDQQVARGLELVARGVAEASLLTALGVSVAAYLAGDWPGIVSALDRIQVDVLPPELLRMTLLLRTRALTGLGEPSRAVLVAEQAIEMAGPPVRFRWQESLASALLLAGDMERAPAALRVLLAEADRLGWPDAIALTYALASLFDCRAGNLEAGHDRLSHANRVRVHFLSIEADVALAFAQASCDLSGGDEAQAQKVIRAELAERPLGTPLTHLVHLMNLVPIYVLAPESRGYWDSLPLGPAWEQARSLARAVAALRDQEDSSAAASLRPFPTDVARVHVPAPWAVELAMAASDSTDEASRAIDQLGPAHSRWLPALTASPVAAVRSRARSVLAGTAPPSSQEVTVRVFGFTQLLRGSELVDDPAWRPRVRELLAYLVVHRHARREQVIDALWPELSEAAGRRNLRFTLACLRRVLEPGRQARQPTFFVRTEGEQLQLVADHRLHVDLWAFQRQLDVAATLESPAGQLDALLAAVALRQGPFLADFLDADWATVPRSQVEERFVAAAIRAGELQLGRMLPEEALHLARLALDADPHSERAFRLLAAAQLAQGDRGAARQTLARCREALRDLGADAELETEILERATGQR